MDNGIYDLADARRVNLEIHLTNTIDQGINLEAPKVIRFMDLVDRWRKLDA